ncbi:adipokinetic hormone [Anastrepha obliqua]|uniref:adipokinetic hormone n=1 Tax=Anastrepha ludens TaxID=28586 RepID=UPI0023B0D635|nr:adipokinetic hormone [Anastrepha ludens]XP_054733536.1 adipokinetic hormone [Anastrepha obliqua]
MISTRTQVFVAMFLLVLAVANCQLTFSPDWGKRSVGSSSSVGSGTAGFFDAQPSGNCKTSNEMLLEIFRFVQAQAQLFLDCKHRE